MAANPGQQDYIFTGGEQDVEIKISQRHEINEHKDSFYWMVQINDKVEKVWKMMLCSGNYLLVEKFETKLISLEYHL